jgi:hypothetical protein
MAGSATGGGGSTPKSASQGPWPSSADCKSGASAVEGTWSGYVQGEGHAYDFTLVLGGGEAQPCGTLTIGEPRDYPPATDPEHNITADEFYFKAPPLLPGYTYTVLDAALDASRLQFRLSFAEAYASWCALQTSYPNPAGDEYRCLPSSYNTNYVVHGDRCVGTVDGMPVDVACEHVTMCLDVEGDNAPCFCDASGCAANLEASGAQFDLHVDGDQASGLWDDRNVFLQRQ